MLTALAVVFTLSAAPQPSARFLPTATAAVAPGFTHGLLLQTTGEAPSGEVVADRTLGGVKKLIAGIVCLVFGAPFLGAGGYFLYRSFTEPQSSNHTVFTALGGSLGGVGALLWTIGLPFLIVGIVQLARRAAPVSAVAYDGEGGMRASVAF